MCNRESQRGRLARVEVQKLRRVKRLWLDPDPPFSNRIGQLPGAWEVAPGEHFLANVGRDGDLP